MASEERDGSITNDADQHQPLVSAVTAAVAHDRSVADALRTLLVASGRVSAAVELFTSLTALVDRMAAAVGLISSLIPPDVLANEVRRRHIRQFFLAPQETYLIAELAALWEIASESITRKHLPIGSDANGE